MERRELREKGTRGSNRALVSLCLMNEFKLFTALIWANPYCILKVLIDEKKAIMSEVDITGNASQLVNSET